MEIHPHGNRLTPHASPAVHTASMHMDCSRRWGISCFGIRQRPTLPGVSPRALFLRGTRIVASPGRSLRFPTLCLPVSATGGGRLRTHRARMGKNLAKYNVALTCRRPGSSSLPGVSHRALFLRGTRTVAALWPLLAIPDAPPRCVAHRARSASVPQGAHGEKPSQVQCMHSPGYCKCKKKEC